MVSLHPPIALYQGQKVLHNNLRRNFHWPHMATDVDHIHIANQCASCARKNFRYHHQRRLLVYPASGPFDFHARDIVGPIPKTTQRNQYIHVITNQYLKLLKAITTSKTPATHVANSFLEHCLNIYGSQRTSLLTTVLNRSGNVWNDVFPLGSRCLKQHRMIHKHTVRTKNSIKPSSFAFDTTSTNIK